MWRDFRFRMDAALSFPARLRVLAVLWTAAVLLAACASQGAPRASAGDCVTVTVWSNGWHTNIALPADAMEADHPLRMLFPGAEHFLIGWGERDFYLDEDPGFWTGLDAIIPPSLSVMQVIAADEPVENRIWRGEETVRVALSRAGRARLAREIGETLALDEAGSPVIVQGGRVEGTSLFLEARPDFHLFHMCNHWTAARLAGAGVKLRPSLAFHAPWLTGALKRNAPQSCPAS